jgi:uncharacterized membrane protein YqjE
MAVETNDGRRGIGALLRDLAEGSVTLVRREAELAKLELASASKHVGLGTGMIAVGAVLALLGLLTLLAGLILLVGDQWLPRDYYWLAALIFVVLTGILAAVFAKKGMALLAPKQLAPDQTVETLQEDKEWLRRQLKSGATSS